MISFRAFCSPQLKPSWIICFKTWHYEMKFPNKYFGFFSHTNIWNSRSNRSLSRHDRFKQLMRSEAEIYADRGEVIYMHYCKIEMYADRAGGICTMQGWYNRGEGIYTMHYAGLGVGIKSLAAVNHWRWRNRATEGLRRLFGSTPLTHLLHWLSDRLHNNIMEVNKGEGQQQNEQH